MLLIVHIVIAVVAVAALALRPKSNLATAVVAAAALSDVALGAAPGPVVSVIAPLIAFLGAALTLAGFVQRSGLAERAAGVLAARARGSSLLLYVLVCALCVALTAAISLDGAVVLMVPLLLVLDAALRGPLRAAVPGHGCGRQCGLDRGSTGQPDKPRDHQPPRPVGDRVH